jgi:hypothetical protein
LHAFLMAVRSWHVPCFCPAAVAVHDDSNMLWGWIGIQSSLVDWAHDAQLYLLGGFDFYAMPFSRPRGYNSTP